jgi:hypothetical protein
MEDFVILTNIEPEYDYYDRSEGVLEEVINDDKIKIVESIPPAPYTSVPYTYTLPPSWWMNVMGSSTLRYSN